MIDIGTLPHAWETVDRLIAARYELTFQVFAATDGKGKPDTYKYLAKLIRFSVTDVIS
jgi:hypothetical protein